MRYVLRWIHFVPKWVVLKKVSTHVRSLAGYINIGFLGRWGTCACPQCLPSDTVPIRSWTRTLRPPGIRHRHLPYHHTTIPGRSSSVQPSVLVGLRSVHNTGTVRTCYLRNPTIRQKTFTARACSVISVAATRISLVRNICPYHTIPYHVHNFETESISRPTSFSSN